ncbi:MAG TPA: glycosyltransferase [Kineosporiaceae bacterium]|nr:glycosyltransferase [Kineosporiaceae bacterium]
MRILVWHVHGSWMTAFVQGAHEYLVPVVPGRGPDGRGLARTYPWPGTVREVSPQQLAAECIDVVVLQRMQELELVRRWTGCRPGVDLPALYVEHNTPRGDVADWRHPLADDDRIPLVHVTDFNAAMWENGRAPVRVIEHGVPDPGYRWTGERTTLAVCVNEPVRRWRVAGMDLAARIAREVPIEVYGIGAAQLPGRIGTGLAAVHEDLPQAQLHEDLARHRAYLHPFRWTSLGLALVEAMMLGLPVLALASTAAPDAVTPGAGLVSADVGELARLARRLVRDPELAAQLGRTGRRYAIERFGLPRFLADWDAALSAVSARWTVR